MQSAPCERACVNPGTVLNDCHTPERVAKRLACLDIYDPGIRRVSSIRQGYTTSSETDLSFVQIDGFCSYADSPG